MTASDLYALITDPDLVVAPGVYDGISAGLVERSDFPVAYMSGAAVAASAVGLPDIGLATMTEMVSQATVIKRRLSKPLIADDDTGFGDVTNVYRTVQEYERIGVAAVQLEDQVFPKRCGHLDEKTVVDPGEFSAKIRAAVDARSDMLVIARTDARAVYGIDEALCRAKMYVAAGADVIFVEAPESVDEIARIPGEVDAPVLFNLVPRGKTPPVSLHELHAFGYSLVIAPAVGLGGAVRGITEALSALSRQDTSGTDLPSPRDLFDVVGLSFWENLRTAYAGDEHRA
jgi:2-methylisocitrate lyase-like PEP mutase family enzyme